MLKRVLFPAIVLLCITSIATAESEDMDKFFQQLQDASVTIKSGRSEGSGTIVTRTTTVDEESDEEVIVNFVWTAGHVIDDLRRVRTIINPKGDEKKLVEFDDAHIVKELNESGRRVGELKMDAKVIKYSDADNNEDLALLMVIKRDFVEASSEFYLNEDIIRVGTRLYHCGSLLGQMGANSMTDGMMSQIGRVYRGKIYDQTTVSAFPGSSGGGVFVCGDGGKPEYVGMVVRGSGETFNLMVPVRRLVKWAKDNNLEWAIDPDIEMPTLKEIKEIPVEGETIEGARRQAVEMDEDELNFLIKERTTNLMPLKPC
jgi:hypothetical protein